MINTIELKELRADAGMVLTNGYVYSDVGGSVYLGVNDSPDNWYELTESEYNKKLAEEEEQ